MLYVLPTLETGGTERRFVRLLDSLDRRQYAPIVACVDAFGELYPAVRAAGVEPVLVGRDRKFDVGTVARLRALIRRERPVVVHSWLYLANLYGRIAARLARAPVVVASETGALQAVSPRKQAAIRAVDRSLATVTDRVVVNSEAVRTYVRATGIADSKIAVIPNGVPLPEPPASGRTEELRSELGCDPGEQLVGMIARFDSDFKDHETFLRAAQLLVEHRADARFVLVGDGPGRGPMERLAAELGIASAVRFAGNRADAHLIAAVLDVAVLCTLSEGLSNTILEAMAGATPVVATRIPANAEVVSDGVSGLLVPLRDAAATARAIARLLDDRALADRMGMHGREVVRERFSLARQAELTMALYDGLIAEKRG